MKEYKKSSGFKGGAKGSFGEKKGFGKKSFSREGKGGNFGGGFGSHSLHRAMCDGCGKPCEVPFRPSGEKPVYCNDCFGGKKGVSDFSKKREASSSAPLQSEGLADIKSKLLQLEAKIDLLLLQQNKK